MDQIQVHLLMPFNYYQWKSKMLISLRSKGLFGITMGAQTGPMSPIEKLKWFYSCDGNRMDCHVYLYLHILFSTLNMIIHLIARDENGLYNQAIKCFAYDYGTQLQPLAKKNLSRFRI